jgi:hypothetical protein
VSDGSSIHKVKRPGTSTSLDFVDFGVFRGLHFPFWVPPHLTPLATSGRTGPDHALPTFPRERHLSSIQNCLRPCQPGLRRFQASLTLLAHSQINNHQSEIQPLHIAGDLAPYRPFNFTSFLLPLTASESFTQL